MKQSKKVNNKGWLERNKRKDLLQQGSSAREQAPGVKRKKTGSKQNKNMPCAGAQ